MSSNQVFHIVQTHTFSYRDIKFKAFSCSWSFLLSFEVLCYKYRIHKKNEQNILDIINNKWQHIKHRSSKKGFDVDIGVQQWLFQWLDIPEFEVLNTQEIYLSW